MSTLHIVNKPASHTALASCLKVVQSSDTLLLIEDGVYAISQLELPPGLTVCVLREDLDARGLSDTDLPAAINPIDYTGFVDLVCSHQRSVSWT